MVSPSCLHRTQYTSHSSTACTTLDVATLELAIGSGIPEAVGEVLARMTKAQATEQLTTPYPGEFRFTVASKGSDEHEEHVVSSAILHAALSGNVEMVSAVLVAMRERLSPCQVTQDYCCARGERGSGTCINSNAFPARAYLCLSLSSTCSIFPHNGRVVVSYFRCNA